MEIQFSRKAEETHHATYEHNKSFIVYRIKMNEKKRK